MFREELGARMTSASYVDTAVGAPDRAAQRRSFVALGHAAKAVEDGTGRLRLALLGTSVATPDRVSWMALASVGVPPGAASG